MSLIRIVVGTMSRHKLSSVEEASRRLGFENVEVVGCTTISGVNEQPVNMNDTATGAVNRARQARVSVPNASMWIGIESGVFRAPDHHISVDLAVIVVMKPDGTCVFATSPGITFPEHFVVEAEREGFVTTTAGSVIAECLGCDGTDPHSGLTDGRVTRLETLIQGVMIAFRQTHISH